MLWPKDFISLCPGARPPPTVSHGMWAEGKDREDLAAHGQCSAPAVSGRGSRSQHTGAGGEVPGGGESLTLVIIGSDDLGLLRELLHHQVSCLRKTKGSAVLTGTLVKFSLVRVGSCACLQRCRLAEVRLIQDLLDTCPPVCIAPGPATHD